MNDHQNTIEGLLAPGAAPTSIAPKAGTSPVAPLEPQASKNGRRILADFLTEDETASELRQAKRTLRKWRTAGSGPPFIKVGRDTLYPRDALLEWLSSKLIKPVRERKLYRRHSA